MTKKLFEEIKEADLRKSDFLFSLIKLITSYKYIMHSGHIHLLTNSFHLRLPHSWVDF